MRRAAILAAFLFIGFSSQVRAQPERYDAGRKLIAFEEEWDKRPDPASRKRSIPHMKSALNSFFANNYSEAARHLDLARRALQSSEESKPLPDGLFFRPNRRLIDLNRPDLSYSVGYIYRSHPADGNQPATPPHETDPPKLEVETIQGAKAPFQAVFLYSGASDQTPVALKHPVEGDFVFKSSCFHCRFVHVISIVKNLNDRLSRITAAADKLTGNDLATEQRTLKTHAKLLNYLAKGGVAETDYPAHRLLLEAEDLAARPAGMIYFNASRPGQFWLTLSTKSGAAPVRVFVPPQAKEGKPHPLVVAMHGAGGTENLFFDGYGHGEIVRQCEKRGWLLVAPRADFFGNAPIAAIVDELSARYPVDAKRVFLVGHSMGAAQAVTLAQQSPDRWAGVAALGGAARVTKPETFRSVPLYVGCGAEDFALSGARELTKAVQAGGGNIVSKEYDDIEHILIVQVALPDVFRWFDRLPRR